MDDDSSSFEFNHRFQSLKIQNLSSIIDAQGEVKWGSRPTHLP